MFIIGEAGSNYNSSLENAKRLIDIANKSGVDSCKFQMIYTKELYLIGKEYNYGHYDIKEVLKIRDENEFSSEVWELINNYGKTIGIDVSFSIFGNISLKIASKLGNSKYIKLASCDLKYLELIEKTALQCKKSGKFLIFSTGMSKFKDIENAYKSARRFLNDNEIVILYCVSAYPADLSDININKIENFKKSFGCGIGFSDHTQSTNAACAAYGAGARWFEKHFTIDNKMIGLDHKYAAEEADLTNYVNTLRALDKANKKSTAISHKEEYTANRAIRGLYSSRQIKKGTVLKRSDINIVRPQTSISPNQIELIIGKTLLEDMKINEPFELNKFKKVIDN